LKKSHLKKMNQ